MPNKNKQTKRKKSVAKKPKIKVPRKRAISKRSSVARKKVKFSAKRRRVTSTGLVVETVALQSGEPRKLYDGPTANAESMEELLEEGNVLEGVAIQGAEDALNTDQGEVQTHEVPEQEVPEEYLDKDQ